MIKPVKMDELCELLIPVVEESVAEKRQEVKRKKGSL